VAHRVGDDHALHRVQREAVVEEPELQCGDAEQRGLRQAVGDDPLAAGRPQVDQGDDAGHRQEDDLGEDG
jgi:hypothetical protein